MNEEKTRNPEREHWERQTDGARACLDCCARLSNLSNEVLGSSDFKCYLEGEIISRKGASGSWASAVNLVFKEMVFEVF